MTIDRDGVWEGKGIIKPPLQVNRGLRANHRAPALEVLAERPRPAGVHYHSIIGQAPAGDALKEVAYVLGQTDRRSDGVVPYSSAHIDGVEGRIGVDANEVGALRPAIAPGRVRKLWRVPHGTHDFEQDHRNDDILVWVNGELVPRP